MQTDLHSVVIRIAAGDADAFRELFDNFSPKVYAFALKLTHSPAMAEELVQEVFMRVWIRRAELEKVNHFPAYLYTITRNLTFNVLKRLSVEERAKAAYFEGMREEMAEQEAGVNVEYQSLLQKAIDRLSPQQKMVYSLCYGEGLKYEEAAQRLRVSRLTVKTHMQHALRNIKLHFKRIAMAIGTAIITLF